VTKKTTALEIDATQYSIMLSMSALGKTENGLEERAVDRIFGERTRRNCKTYEDGPKGALQFVTSGETSGQA
jgi:hypothetical protein